ncbi:MAG: phospholipase [Gemmatimonadetes bacterium]|nr:phospholipase [Gemmatimonadota bacterium]
MQEHHLAVTRTARYYTLGPLDRGTREVWFVCHGYRHLAGPFLRRFEPLNDGTRLIVAPEALSRFYLDDTGGPHGPDARVGATWMTREDRLTDISDYVGYLDALHAHVLREQSAESRRIVALGFSQGAATASRWGVLGSARIDHLVLWAALLPPDLDWHAAAARLPGSAVTFAVGRDDRTIDRARLAEQRERLAGHGVAARVLEFEGGHEITEAALGELGALVATRSETVIGT